ncbi:hypothetical protein ACFWY9_16880 [Amycolatopsis sp. NPDC059027]|uniref:hypothetical protein n=1 Tax=Amycolatopsis sp. NPDC059027 TaxID=3346709 RepID=UPI00366EEFE7
MTVFDGKLERTSEVGESGLGIVHLDVDHGPVEQIARQQKPIVVDFGFQRGEDRCEKSKRLFPPSGAHEDERTLQLHRQS